MQATRTQKQGKLRIENPTKKPLVQFQMNLARQMPNFKRYNFFPDGRVVNIATEKEIQIAATTGVKGFRLTNDKGARAWVYPADIEALFKEEPKPKEARRKPSAYVKKLPNRKNYVRLSEDQKSEIKAMLNGGKKLPRGEGRKFAIKFNVDEANISRVVKSFVNE